jgi:zinc transport system ATP-binding protein
MNRERGFIAPSSMTTSVLAIENVSVRREGELVLDSVDLAVEASSVHVVVGPNGAGKSTLLAAALGRVEFTGSIVRRFAKSNRIGFVPQALATDRTLPVTVAELLALTRQAWPVCFGIRAAARARIVAALEAVGLAGFEARRLGELSGGELRRVLLANAIEPVPELLILDEPASGMDQESKDRLDDVVRSAARENGAAVLMVSHDLDRVRAIADRVTWLERKVLRSGAASDVLESGAADG